MNNRLIAIAAAVSLLAPLAAHAAEGMVTFYGAGDVSLNYENNDNSTPHQAKDAISLSSNQSHLGVTAVEALPYKWRAMAQVEGSVEFDTGAIFSDRLRDTFVGMERALRPDPRRALRLGLQDATEWMDPFKDTLADAQAVLGNVDGTVLFSQWYNNIFGWQSPVYKHTQLDVDYIVNQGADNLPLSVANHKRNGFSLSTQFRNEGFDAGFAYELRDAVSSTGGAGSRDIGAFKFFTGIWLPTTKRHTFVTAVLENAEQADATNTSVNNRSAFYTSISQYWAAISSRPRLAAWAV